MSLQGDGLCHFSNGLRTPIIIDFSLATIHACLH